LIVGPILYIVIIINRAPVSQSFRNEANDDNSSSCQWCHRHCVGHAVSSGYIMIEHVVVPVIVSPSEVADVISMFTVNGAPGPVE